MTPETPQDIKACMNDTVGLWTQKYVRSKYEPGVTKIVDIGAGWGKYARLLPEFDMDAVEIFPPHKPRFEGFYTDYILADVVEWEPEREYDLAIMGDVFEHITVDRAQAMLERLWPKLHQWLIIVPWMLPQEAIENNPAEEHQQDDLDAAVMESRYGRWVKAAWGDSSKGIYIKNGSWL